MKRRKFIFTTILASSSIIFYGCFKSSASKTVENFYRYIEKGEVDEAIQLISPTIINTFGESKVRLAMSQSVKEVNKKGGVKSFKINSEKVIGETAEVSYTMEYKDGSREDNTVDLTQIDGEWKISPNK